VASGRAGPLPFRGSGRYGCCVQYRVLGPLEVLDGARAIPLGGPKQRLVLASLVVRANQVVPTERLIDEIWGDEPPEAARNALQSYLSRLRAALGKDRIEGRAGGYLLRAEPKEVDALRFEALLREARSLLAADPGAAAAKLERALGLWRGPALADLAAEPSLRREIARLEELRLSATEHRIAAELALGRHTTVVGRLEVLTEQHPLRERLWGQLMLALYRSGRQGEALASYHRARAELVEELGIEPSPELRRLYEQILNQDPAIELPTAATPPAGATSAGDLAPGAEFAGYRIESVLGRGGMSVVYLAEHEGLGRKVALKLLASRLAEDARFRERFVRESQIAASLDHPNVIPIYEAGELGGQLFIAMRYVAGTDLRALLRERGSLEPERALSIVRQVAGALDAAHAEGLVHRDVKPGNVLISRPPGSEGDEHVYLADFGLTKRTSSESGIAETGHFVGTLAYAAPEQFRGKPLDARTDIYSLGCVLYECLVGHAPFRAETDAMLMYAHLTQAPPPVTDERPELPGGIDDVVATAMAKEPVDRYASCGDLADAATELGLAPEPRFADRAAKHRQPARRRRPWRPRLVVIGVIAGLLLAALIAALLQVIRGKAAGASFQPGIAIVDAQTGEQLASIPTSIVREPKRVIFAEGHFWVQNLDPLSYVEIDPRTGRVLRQIASPVPEGGNFAVEGETLWVGGSEIVKIDINLGRALDRFRFSDWHNGMIVAEGSLWVTIDGTTFRADPATGKVEHRFADLPGSVGLTYGEGAVWTAGNGGVNRIDPDTNAVTKTELELPEDVGEIAAGGGFGWTADPTKGVVYKVDRSGRIVATYQTGQGAKDVSYHDDMLWVANSDVGTVVGIDAVTGARRTFRFEHPVEGAAAGSGVLLVALGPGRTYEDRIEALEGKVAKLFVPLYLLEEPDPATIVSEAVFWIENATCAKLLNYPDAPAPAGWELRPEVAASMPAVSRDGRTYTFRIRPGYQFSPPSNEEVTAETFRYSIERALSPKLEGPAPEFVSDIKGEGAFLAGKADHISGLRARGDVLTISLTRPSPNFLQRLTLPFFCPVPTDSPLVRGGAGAYVPYAGRTPEAVPAAGPYYIADHVNAEYAILKRNPNYTGPRPRVLDAIALREGVNPGQAVSRVQNRSWDGIAHVDDPLLDVGSALDQRWGARSPAASEGDQRYVAAPSPHTGFLLFNSQSRLFADRDVRRAAALTLDRQALADVWKQVPTDQILPPVMPAFVDRDLYRLDGADLAQAKALMQGRTGVAVMGIVADCGQCLREAEEVRADLARIGIGVRIEEFDNPWETAREPGAEIDILDGGWTLDYADPAEFLRSMLLDTGVARWLPPGVQAEVREVSRLEGAERATAAAELADRLAEREVPFAAVGTGVVTAFLSPRLECRIFPPFGYGVDLASLCA
jgi:DNA-binding SARP family transcriptional activator/ABC-type oligopeptide transport system substrate-binding subunit